MFVLLEDGLELTRSCRRLLILLGWNIVVQLLHFLLLSNWHWSETNSFLLSAIYPLVLSIKRDLLWL